MASITDQIKEVLAQKEQLEAAIKDIAENKENITDLLSKIDNLVGNEGDIRNSVTELLEKTESIKESINDKMSSSKDYVDDAFNMLKDTISNIENTLNENVNETGSKLETLFKEIAAVKEKIVSKEDYEKEVNKINELIADLAEENNAMSEFLKQSTKDVADIYEEAKALHLKNIEQDEQLAKLKNETASNKTLISTNTKKIREDIDNLQAAHSSQLNHLSSEMKKLKEDVKNEINAGDNSTRAAIERLSDIIDGLLIEDEKVNSRISIVLSELNTKITKLNKRWISAFIPVVICLLALGIVGLIV